MSTPIRDLTGMRVGKLVVLKIAPRDGSGRTKWVCQCDCGKSTIVMRQKLVNQHTRSCGCLISSRPLVPREAHGCSHGKDKATSEYVSWKSMRNRCQNPTNHAYAEYGGKGIAICPEWDSFQKFLADMGPKPHANMSIDRIDNNKGYEPGNCRWATSTEQNNNKRNVRSVEYNGDIITLRKLANETGIKQETLYERIFTHGWSVERATSEPVRRWPSQI